MYAPKGDPGIFKGSTQSLLRKSIITWKPTNTVCFSKNERGFPSKFPLQFLESPKDVEKVMSNCYDFCTESTATAQNINLQVLTWVQWSVQKYYFIVEIDFF